MNKYSRNILVTGGAGFIGSHVVRLLVQKYPDYRIVNYDKLTYAGNLANLKDIEDYPNYIFIHGDICDLQKVKSTLEKYDIDGIIHLAAESHVDRSIKNPFEFAQTNVMGTLSLLEAARQHWQKTDNGFSGKLFYHISTDEVYGALPMENSEQAPFGKEFFVESTGYNPHSPYSASKASSDHFVRAYHDTYGLPTIITNCSNNYGPNQFPEKLIPLIINNIKTNSQLPVYGKGLNVRDWLYVEDHADAIDLIFHKGQPGETYNIGSNNEWRNIDLVKEIVSITDSLLGNNPGHSLHLIKYVTDRAGHDLRYAIDSSKLRRELGWKPKVEFKEGLRKTIKWYLDNEAWVNQIISGEYKDYYNRMYNNR